MTLPWNHFRAGLTCGLAICIAMLAMNCQAQTSKSSFLTSSGQKAKPQQQKKPAGLLSAQPQTKPASPAAKTRQPFKLSGPRKSEVMKFVRENHAELERLLNFLEKKRKPQYESAMRGLVRNYDRLQLLEKDTPRYKNALEQWKLKSRIQLAAAQVATRETPQRLKRLEQLVRQQLSMQSRQLNAELDRTKKRLARLQQQLGRVDKDRDAETKRLMDSAIKTSKRAFVKADPKSKSADAKSKPGNKAKSREKTSGKKAAPANNPGQSGGNKPKQTDKKNSDKNDNKYKTDK